MRYNGLPQVSVVRELAKIETSGKTVGRLVITYGPDGRIDAYLSDEVEMLRRQVDELRRNHELYNGHKPVPKKGLGIHNWDRTAFTDGYDWVEGPDGTRGRIR